MNDVKPVKWSTLGENAPIVYSGEQVRAAVTIDKNVQNAVTKFTNENTHRRRITSGELADRAAHGDGHSSYKVYASDNRTIYPSLESIAKVRSDVLEVQLLSKQEMFRDFGYNTILENMHNMREQIIALNNYLKQEIIVQGQFQSVIPEFVQCMIHNGLTPQTTNLVSLNVYDFQKASVMKIMNLPDNLEKIMEEYQKQTTPHESSR